MAQRFFASVAPVAFAFTALACAVGAAVACGHGNDADSANNANTPQPTEDQIWQMADDTAAEVPDDGDGSIDDLPGANGPDPDAGPTTPAANPNLPPMPAGWTTLNATACGLTIYFPADAKEDAPTTGAHHRYHHHLEGEPDGSYLVQCTNFQRPHTNAAAFLAAATKKISTKGTVTATTPVTVGAFQGNDLKLNLASGGNAEARILWSPNKSIILLVGMEKRLWSQSDADAFLQSIQLNP